jgi:hypothetical protein
MATSRFVEITDKEISEIKINSVQHKTSLCKNTRTIIHLRLGDYHLDFVSVNIAR